MLIDIAKKSPLFSGKKGAAGQFRACMEDPYR